MTKPKIIAEAKLTKDMVDTLNQYFDDLAEEGIVTLKVTEEHGVWLQNADGRKLFLGATELFPRGRPIH